MIPNDPKGMSEKIWKTPGFYGWKIMALGHRYYYIFWSAV